MSASRAERTFGVREIAQSWLDEFYGIERQRANHAAEGMRLLHQRVKIIWSREKGRLETAGKRFNPFQPLVARVDIPHAAVPREIIAILSSEDSNAHGLRLVPETRECEVKVFNPELALRLQFEMAGRRFEIHNMHPEQPASSPVIDVWPLADSVKDKLTDPVHLLAKIIRALPHIVALDYTQSR